MKQVQYKAYDGTEPYCFVSYAHADVAKVENILHILFRQGIRIWYDQRGEGIPADKEWEKHITERVNSSKMFFAFMTNGVEEREQVMREIHLAIEKKKRRFKL